VVASRRVWAVAAMTFLVAAVLVIGGSVAAVPAPTYSSAHTSSGSQPHHPEPSCAQSANCAGGGALSGGFVFVAATACGSRLGLERVPTYSRLVVSDSGHLPSGVAAPLFHPPKSSSI
jgi:hypothetical protein